jgi:hypothetical protein
VYYYTTTSTTRLNNLAYVFKNRGNVNTTLIKNAFQKLYQARDYAIFDTFWNNAGLRGELFPGLPIQPIPQAIKDLKKIDLKNMVDTKNPILYNFIKIK